MMDIESRRNPFDSRPGKALIPAYKQHAQNN